MIIPKVYSIRLSPNNTKTYLYGETTTVNMGEEKDIPAFIINVTPEKIEVCTDYFESVCIDCAKTSCYFNPRNRKEG